MQMQGPVFKIISWMDIVRRRRFWLHKYLMDFFRFKTLKTHTNAHAVRDRPTLNDGERQFRPGSFRELKNNSNETQRNSNETQRNSNETQRNSNEAQNNSNNAEMMVHVNESPNIDTSRYSCVNLSQDSCDKIKEANWGCIKATSECSENDTSSVATFTAKPVTTKASLFCTVTYCILISCSFIHNVISREAVMSNDLHVGGLFIVVSCVVLVVQLLYYFLSTENIEKGETVEKEFTIILKEVRKNFGTTTATDISLVKEHVSRYAKHIHFLRVDSEQIAQVNRTRRDREPSRITKRHLPHVFSKSRKERKRARSYLMKNLPKTSKLCHVTRCSFSHREKYSSYLKYAFKSRKYKNSFHSGGGFFKSRKKRTNGKKTEKVACQVRFIKVFQRSMFTLMFSQITRTEWLSSSTSFVEISRKIQALFQEDIL